MEPKKIRTGKRPEAKIQDELIIFLRGKGWHVMVTHGNAFQSGFPDLFCTHSKYGPRWIDVKNPDSYKFTEAQLDQWPKMSANGAGVWILVAASEHEYEKLFKRHNFWTYLDNWRIPKRKGKKKEEDE